MQFTYDPRYNVAYIRFGDKRADVEAVRVGDELIVDMTPDGAIYGIELLNANEQLQRSQFASLVVINQATDERAEVPLAVGE